MDPNKIIAGLVEKVKALETREEQEHQENIQMKQELLQLHQKFKSLESAKETPTPLVYVKSERKFPNLQVDRKRIRILMCLNGSLRCENIFIPPSLRTGMLTS